MRREGENVYFAELMRALHRMISARARLKSEPDKRAHLKTIIEFAAKIQDLAMVHGYEGVENVAARFCKQVEPVRRRAATVEISDAAIAGIESGVLAIKEIAELEDSAESELVVANAWRMDSSATQHGLAGPDDALHNRAGAKQMELFRSRYSGNLTSAGMRNLFEISEPDVLYKLKNRSETDSKNGTLDLFD